MTPQDQEIPEVKNMKAEERIEARIQTSMKDVEHMKRWLRESGRPFMIFKSDDICDALMWPHGHEALQEITDAYDHHRSVMPTGRTRIETDPITKYRVEVPVMKSQKLEPEEMEECIRHLVGVLSENDPLWTLEKFLNAR